ncbi:ABC transporter permease [Paenibacillus selenitireducens]|uniref:ABC transporter permease n=1 Tax=Paenibacillus selenitireducens TaxID=1324314 RepID=A0A1T2X0I6_9BACL|nr:ABC-2 transporter permease [Paenibacillus selenitireducens]OPA73315.1 ABC transporter permease [Paenibacillus selenitireducens]
MLLHLVKKDILIAKKYVWIMMVVAIAIPLFFMVRAPDLLGVSAFLTSVVFTELMLFQSVSMAELKYPKAAALLCAAPISRSAIVLARYIFLIFIFAYCYVTYSLMAWIMAPIEHLTLIHVLTVLLISTILISVYTPIQYKYGYEKTKYFFSILIVATPFVLPAIIKSNMLSQFDGFFTLPESIQYLTLIAAIMISNCISIYASIRIYSNKELL